MTQNGSNAAQAARNIDEVLANLSADELTDARQSITARAVPHGARQHAGLGATILRADARGDLMAFGVLEGTPARGVATAEPSIASVGPGYGEDTARPPVPPGGWLSECKKAAAAPMRVAGNFNEDHTAQPSAPSTPVAAERRAPGGGAVPSEKGDMDAVAVPHAVRHGLSELRLPMAPGERRLQPGFCAGGAGSTSPSQAVVLHAACERGTGRADRFGSLHARRMRGSLWFQLLEQAALAGGAYTARQLLRWSEGALLGGVIVSLGSAEVELSSVAGLAPRSNCHRLIVRDVPRFVGCLTSVPFLGTATAAAVLEASESALAAGHAGWQDWTAPDVLCAAYRELSIDQQADALFSAWREMPSLTPGWREVDISAHVIQSAARARIARAAEGRAARADMAAGYDCAQTPAARSARDLLAAFCLAKTMAAVVLVRLLLVVEASDAIGSSQIGGGLLPDELPSAAEQPASDTDSMLGLALRWCAARRMHRMLGVAFACNKGRRRRE